VVVIREKALLWRRLRVTTSKWPEIVATRNFHGHELRCPLNHNQCTSDLSETKMAYSNRIVLTRTVISLSELEIRYLATTVRTTQAVATADITMDIASKAKEVQTYGH
jgi:hypothetical protein